MNLAKTLSILWFFLFPLGISIGFYLIYSGLFGMFGRFLAYICFTGLFILTSVLIVTIGPKRIRIDAKDWEEAANQYHPQGYDSRNWNILLDTHFHTTYSDGKMTIEEGIKWHIAMGFNAFFVTDHDTTENFEEIMKLQEIYKDKCLVIPGVELAGALGHLNVIGLNKQWDISKYVNFKTGEDVKAIVKDAHEQGALVTWNHYPWSYGGKIPRYSYEPPREDVMAWGVDFIEAVNWDDDIDPIDRVSYDFCKQHPGIAPVVGTDVHTPEKDRLYGWTLVHTNSFSVDELMKELHEKRTEILFLPGGIQYPTRHSPSLSYFLFRPLYDFGDIFVHFHQGGAIKNVDFKAVFVWVIYVIAGFLFFEIIYFLLKFSTV